MRSKIPVTRILQARDVTLDRDSIISAGETIRSGGLVVFPTETVYGLGANALDGDAVGKIFKAKGRPQDNPLIVHIAEPEELRRLVTVISPQAQMLADAYWPGPLTMIFSRADTVPGVVSAGLDTVAVRLPSHPVARALIKVAGVPVAAPSANRSGSPSPTLAQHCILDLDGRVDIILDGGPCEVGLESTVISFAGERPLLLRPGGITVGQLEVVIGPVEVDPAVLHPLGEGLNPSSPGMKYKHYAPKAEVYIVHGDLDQFVRLCQTHQGKGVYAMCFDGETEQIGIPAVGYGRERHAEEQAQRLFAALRELDEKGAKTIYVRPPYPDGVGLAVYNRLLRAASFRQISTGGGYDGF